MWSLLGGKPDCRSGVFSDPRGSQTKNRQFFALKSHQTSYFDIFCYKIIEFNDLLHFYEHCMMICSGIYMHEKFQRIENPTDFRILIGGSYVEYQTSVIQIEKNCRRSYSAINVL